MNQMATRASGKTAFNALDSQANQRKRVTKDLSNKQNYSKDKILCKKWDQRQTQKNREWAVGKKQVNQCLGLANKCHSPLSCYWSQSPLLSFCFLFKESDLSY